MFLSRQAEMRHCDNLMDHKFVPIILILFLINQACTVLFRKLKD